MPDDPALKPPPEHANLRLCPFCGGKPKLCRNGDTDNNIYYIECEACESFAHRDGIGTTLEDGIMVVSALWNRRDPAAIIPDPNDAKMVECVKVALEITPPYFTRHNKGLSGPQWEVCRFGDDGEDEIVVVELAAHLVAEGRAKELTLERRARAVLAALTKRGSK